MPVTSVPRASVDMYNKKKKKKLLSTEETTFQLGEPGVETVLVPVLIQCQGVILPFTRLSLWCSWCRT